jgi:hypothetical protein
MSVVPAKPSMCLYASCVGPRTPAPAYDVLILLAPYTILTTPPCGIALYQPVSSVLCADHGFVASCLSVVQERCVHLRKQIRALATFRLGAHDLDVNAMRFGPHKQQRRQRVCQLCTMTCVDDECHVFECPAQAFALLRAQ